MPRYRVSMLKTVHDILEADIEVEAEDEEAAMQAAIELAEDPEVQTDWEFHSTSEGGGQVEPVSCSLLP